MSTVITDAMVLGYEDRGEADRLYHLFTKKFGKMDVLAKGSQKILSKLGPHLEPPVVSRVLIAKGRAIDKLAGVEIRKTFPKVREDFHKREILFFCLRIVRLSTRPEGADEGVYKFLEEFMDHLEKIPSGQKIVQTLGGESPPSGDTTALRPLGVEKRTSIIISFLLKFFSLIGFYPDFDLPPHLSAKYQIPQKGHDDAGERWGGKNNPSKEKVENWVSGILEKEIRIC